MEQKRHNPEEIVAKLRQVDVLVSQGRSVAEAVLRLTDASCNCLRPEWAKHVRSCHVAESRPHDGRTFRMLNVIDAFTRECLSIGIDRKRGFDRGDRCPDGPVYPESRSRPRPIR
ncbi:hypothetical protein JMM63_17390 [Rhodovulum sulfidophilum]|nr:hypothetical protein [Rhodovulum sulfidophilum]